MYGYAPSGFVSDCPARLAIEILSDKWAVSVIWSLSQGPLRHGEIADVIHGVSRKVLTQTLRRLQGHGLVASEARPQAGYLLTELGRTLIEPIRVLTDWSARNGEAVVDAQEAAALRSGGAGAAHAGPGTARVPEPPRTVAAVMAATASAPAIGASA